MTRNWCNQEQFTALEIEMGELYLQLDIIKMVNMYEGHPIKNETFATAQ